MLKVNVAEVNSFRPEGESATGYASTGLCGSNREERCVNRGIDDRLREANDRAARRVARRPMHLFLKLDSFDCLVGVEHYSDCLLSLFMHHGLRERGLRIERHAPLNAALRLQHDQIFTLKLPRGSTTLVGIIKKDVEIARRVAEHSQQQRNLSSMMNPVNRSVLHQVSQAH